MATPKPGEIRCPTCHRSTPPATFCTQCGSAIPSDARIRPRGLDRDELQERIRARRSGGDPYRRGAAPGDELGGYERFEPDPTDRAAVRPRTEEGPRPDLVSDTPPPPSRAAPFGAGVAGGQALRPVPGEPVTRPDLTRDHDEWTRPADDRVDDREPVAAAPHLAPVDEYRAADDDAGYVEYDEPAYADEYEDWEQEPRERRSAGAGALLILGFLALGVLALLGGAVLAGVFGGDPPTGQVDPTASASASIDAAPSETVEESATPVAESGTPAPSGGPRESGAPIVFPDGFTADVQPCLPGSAEVDGCNSNGSVNGGALDIWVGFQRGTAQDTISAEVFAPDGSSEGAGSMPLARLNCRGTCNGWTYFPFANLPAGTYQVVVTRNGDPAGETSFVVS